MKCPHCLVEVNSSFKEISIGKDSISSVSIFSMICPNEKCKKFILDLVRGASNKDVSFGDNTMNLHPRHIKNRSTIYPFPVSRPIAPTEVDDHIAKDYNEACAVFSLSPKASAALSRRCLQHILREKAGVVKKIYQKKYKKLLIQTFYLLAYLKVLTLFEI